jgi:hypothetical protein
VSVLSCTVWKVNLKLEQTPLPYCLVFAGDGAVPLLQIEGAGVGLHGSCYEAEGVVFAPLFAEIHIVSTCLICVWDGMLTAPPGDALA